MIGLTPLVTFPTARPTHAVARNVNLNRLLLETDCPYFIPKGVSVMFYLSAVFYFRDFSDYACKLWNIMYSVVECPEN